MKFDLKTPCKDCPFIKGSSTNKSLNPGRIDSIVEELRSDLAFTCHKTLDMPRSTQQHCGGALIFLEREERPNQLMRIAERVGIYDYTKLNMDVDLIDP